MDRDEVFGLRDYRKVWKQVILVVLYSVTTQLCYVSFGTGESCKAAQTPMGALAPPYLLVWVWGGGGGRGGVSLAHPKRWLRNERIVVTINASV